MQHDPASSDDDPRVDFVRFRDDGDAAALARVFDRVAQRLLLVASHVSDRAQMPEDLLQDTFLTAIRKADRYDAERPLEPWLVGILVNVTRNDRRRRQRDKLGAHDALGPVDRRQPSDEAIESEFVAEVQRAIDTLPVPQREVMTLNLVHGMTPTEIAHATSRPVGTVKSWIHRSLKHVRARLPSGLTASFAAMLRGMARLDAARAAVLAAAAAAGAVSSGATATASTSATTATTVVAGTSRTVGGARFALALLLLALPLIGWLALRGFGEPSLPPVQAADTRSSPAPAPTEQLPASERSDAAEPSSAAPEPAAGARVGTVHLVGAFDDEPFAWRGYVMPLDVGDSLLRRVWFDAGSDGSHTFRDVPFGSYVLQPDRGPQQGFFVTEPETTVTVPMRGGVDVVGRVVDARGHAVAGASIVQTEPGRLDFAVEVAVSDDAGAFRVRGTAAGRYLAAMAPGWLVSCLRQVPLDADAAAAANIELVLDEAADPLAIEVVDEAGRPIAGALLQLGDMLGPSPQRANAKTRSLRPPWSGTSDANGRATCVGVPRGSVSRLYARAPGRVAVLRVLDGDPGERNVRIELLPGAVCYGALRRGDGAPMSGAARAQPVGGPSGAQVPGWFWSSCVIRPDGTFTLDGVATGRVLLQARSSEGDARQVERVLAAGERTDWLVEIDDVASVEGRALDADGRALAGYTVCTIGDTGLSRYASVASDGAFSVGMTGQRCRLELRAGEQRDALVLHRVHDVRPGAELTLRLSRDANPSATLRGRWLDATTPSIGLFDARGRGHRIADVGEDGAFVFDPVPAGDYVLLAGRTRIVLRRDVRLDAGALVDLGAIECSPTVDVTVRCGAAGDAPVQLFVMSERCGPTIGYARPATGEPHVVPLPPGRCRFLVQQGSGYVCSRVVDVAPGIGPVELDLRGVDVVLPLRAGPGRVECSFEHDDGVVRRFVTNSGSGAAEGPTVRLQVRLPAGRHAVHCRDADGAAAATELTVPLPDGQAVPLLELR